MLNMPILKCAPYGGDARYELDPALMHKHIVAEKWVATDDEGGEGESVEAFCKALVNNLVDEVCNEADRAAYFNMDDVLMVDVGEK